MDLNQFLILAFLTGSAWLYVLMVVVGLGLIIFVHELGHFLVAKACGVKCEKFYLGFDIFGLRIARFRWGETEYGIGILPLGGYVKMLGQEDNPARLRQELERARLSGAAPDAVISEEGLTVATAQDALFSPRSYLAKSVPQRMAIISAGVIMNLIFALVVAVIAFSIGIDEFPCVVGQVAPGEGAWRAGIQPGDRVAAINDRKTLRFQDIQQTIPLTRRGAEVKLTVERTKRLAPDRVETQSLEVRIVPDRIRVIPTIGVSNAFTTQLATPAFLPCSPAASLKEQLQPGWKITAVNGIPISDYAELHRQWALTWGLPVEITLESPEPSAAQDGQSPQRVSLHLPPPMARDLGIVFAVGRIAAVQNDSPAAMAGIQPGDVLIRVECPPDIPWDNDIMRLPYVLQKTLRERPGEDLFLTLSVVRPTEEKPANSDEGLANRRGKRSGKELTVRVFPRLATFYADLYTPDSPWEIPQLGIAVEVLPRVTAVEPNSPAARAGIQPGDVIVVARTCSPKQNAEKEDGQNGIATELDVRFDLSRGPNKATWPTFFHELQKFPPGTQVELTLRREVPNAEAAAESPGNKNPTPEELTVRLEPRVREDWFLPDRQLLLEAMTFRMRANGIAQAFQMGATETWTSVTLIYRILNRLTRGDVSPRALVGPIGLVQTAYRVASQGAGRFLLFLTLLSANLAVVNFLPIPVLDGGHMVFLLYEAISGKPPSEAVYVGLSYLGLAIILGIMLWVFGLDLGLIAR